MADKQIKIWLSVFVFTLMAVGSAASYFAQGRVFYKGTREQGSGMRDEFYASILNTGTENLEPAPELNFKAPEANVIPAPDRSPGQAPAGISPVSSPCSDNERPIIKNGQISGCTNNNTPLQITNYKLPITNPIPAPKVKILNTPSTVYPLPSTPTTPSCESQGRFTYTGPDRPGLLYGMCIDCESSQYIIQGGKCS